MTTEPAFTADTMSTVLEVENTLGTGRAMGPGITIIWGRRVVAQGSLLPLDEASSWSSPPSRAPCTPGANFLVPGTGSWVRSEAIIMHYTFDDRWVHLKLEQSRVQTGGGFLTCKQDTVSTQQGQCLVLEIGLLV